MPDSLLPPPAITPAPPGANWLGGRTVAEREIRRFLKVWVQTLGAPVVTTLLFLVVFVLGLDAARMQVGDTPYAQFLGAGLVMMAVAQAAFANVSSSLVIMKMQGNIVDLLMAPLSPAALLGGLVAGAVARGLAVGVVSLAVIWPFADFPLPDPMLALAATLLAAVILALLGMLAGLWAEKFDQVATVTNFVITPLAFLSGTFYPVARLPEALHILAMADPLFWMIDACRAGLTGHAEGRPWPGVAGLAVLALLLWLGTLALVRRGWRLRA